MKTVFSGRITAISYGEAVIEGKSRRTEQPTIIKFLLPGGFPFVGWGVGKEVEITIREVR